MDELYNDEISKVLPSCEEFLKSRTLKAFVVYGKKGSGKRELSEKILSRIFCDQTLGILAQKLGPKDAFRVEYTDLNQTSESHYKAFAEIQRLMEKKRHIFSIFLRVIRLLLSFTSILDPLDKLKDLAGEIRQSKDKEDALREKELKLFAQFTKEVKRLSRKKPLLVTIGNAQWMDRSSCQLLKYMLHEPSSFWGLIILEYTTEEPGGTHDIDSILWDLIKEDRIHTIKAKLVDTSYFERYQKENFGKVILAGDEADRVIELAQEMPSKLYELMESWKYQKLIFKENGEWTKSNSLKLKELTTPEEKLIALYKVLSKDNVFTAKEEQAYYSQSRSLGLSDEHIDKIRTLAQFETLNPRYHIIKKVRSGIIGDIFKAYDQEQKRYVFIEIEQRLKEAQPEGDDTSGVVSASLLNTLEIRHAENFNFVVTEYTRGTTLEDLRPEYMFFDFQKTYLITKNLLSAISLLHRKNFIHGNIRPDCIFVEDDGSVKVGGIGFIKNLKYDMGKGIAFVKRSAYSSPEHIKGEGLTLQSDVFSLGVIIYELFTGRFPFPGENEKQVSDAILSSPIRQSQYLDEHGDLKGIIYKALDKNDQIRPSSAESLNIAIDHIERPKYESKAGSTDKARPMARAPLVNLKWVMIPILVIVAIVGGNRLIKLIFPTEYDPDSIAINDFTYDARVAFPKGTVERFIRRAMQAATGRSLVASQPNGKSAKSSIVAAYIINGNVKPDSNGSNGFYIGITLNNMGKKYVRTFHCVGPSNLLATTIDEIQSFISDKGQIKALPDGKAFRAAFTNNFEAWQYYNQGQQAWQNLDTEKAVKLLRQAIEVDQKFDLARLRLCEVLTWGNSRKAEVKAQIQLIRDEKINALTRDDDKRLDAVEARINADPATERNCLQWLVERFPTNKEHEYNFAESYFHYAEVDKAIDHYKRALELDPKYSVAHNHLGYCYAWLGDHIAAEKEFKKYLDIDKDKGTANPYDSLASGYMFAGRYEDAIGICQLGLKVENLDGLYGNIASNFLLQGKLKEAESNWKKRLELIEDDNSARMECEFYHAYVDYSRGQTAKARSTNTKVMQFYSAAEYENDLDDASNLPTWLDGVMHYDQKDKTSLETSITNLKQKVDRYGVTEFNYHQVLKYLLHLQLLDASLKGDRRSLNEICKSIMSIRSKLGYWSSVFNLSFMFNECATAFIAIGETTNCDKFISEALKYNNRDPRTYLNEARISIVKKDTDKAKSDLKKASELLARADPDFVLVKQLEKLEQSVK